MEETETTKYVPYIHGQTGNLCLCIMDKRTGHAVSINVRNARAVLERLEREALGHNKQICEHGQMHETAK